ncbi:Guanine nucleotide-binding protein alpha-2 subunit [Tulasnella sp. JGI-2019a]|nr:Guanine nucleotide-binding protein alpha-2 subunit [Tulasnella sp. JGI-2019a]
MGACLSSSEFVNEAEKSAIKRSKVIDKSLEIEKHQRAKDFKILLLGAGESGKSTVVKQMKIIHNGGYTPEELEFFRPIVYKNLLDAAQLIILAMKKLGVDYADNRNRTHGTTILEYRIESDPTMILESHIAEAITSILQDPILPQVLDQSHTFYLPDSAMYFFSQLPRIRANDYVPTETDVLRARAKTSGIMETHFKLGPELSIRMYDVGGQRSERKKWIHCFENVTSIIFCVALSEYDQVLLEEASQNRMDESLILFESVINSRWFQRTSMILFLNKIDVFKEKLRKSPMERHFPEYTGGQDISKAAKYILWRFHMVNRAKLAIYPHLTQATDTSNIKLVTAAVKETLLRNALDESGVI